MTQWAALFLFRVRFTVQQRDNLHHLIASEKKIQPNLDIAPYNKEFPYKDIDKEVERKILSDFNCQVIHNTPEYQTNLDTYTPTNRVLTSMCSPERLLFILKYGITYVRFQKEVDGKIEVTDQKHIMRYQQMFAALIVRQKIDEV